MENLMGDMLEDVAEMKANAEAEGVDLNAKVALEVATMGQDEAESMAEERERAETEKLRAEEQTRSASRLRKMLAGLAMATCAALIFLVIAVIVPVVCFRAMRRHREANRLHSAAVHARLGWLYNKYTDEAYWYELVSRALVSCLLLITTLRYTQAA